MRITASTLANGSGAALRGRSGLAGGLFTLRFFGVFFHRIDAFDIAQDHGLDVEVLFVVQAGGDGGSTLVLLR
jgi:hypothetical protein